MKAYRHGRRTSRAMLFLVAVVVLAGTVTQLTLITRLAAQNKQLDQVSGEVAELRAAKNNLEVAMDQYCNLDRIERLAAGMGMIMPGAQDIRVINVDMGTEETADASVYTVDADGGER